MQITEKTRAEIALALQKLGIEEVKQIATQCHCSNDTVYREWRKIKKTLDGKSMSDNPVVIMLGELAVRRKKEAKELERRMQKINAQLSAA